MKRTKTFLATIAVSALALTLAACGTTAAADAATATTLSDTAPVVMAVQETNRVQSATMQQSREYAQYGGHGAAHQAQGGEMNPAANLPPAGEVDDQEIADLLHMREEEKLARDVYITLGEQWDFPVFTNISKAEQQHMDAVGALLDRYGIEDPVGDNPVGVFTDPELQALYNQLVAQGSQSLAEALKVGATIEDVDIYDLQKAVADTDNADIQQVYKSLLAGSENHMRAFVGVLQQQTGETYTPQYIDQATFDAIMAASNGHGQGGHGGQGGGHGQGGHGQGKGGRGGQGGQAFNLTPNS